MLPPRSYLDRPGYFELEPLPRRHAGIVDPRAWRQAGRELRALRELREAARDPELRR